MQVTQRLHIRRLSSGGIITNYFCTSACRHCLYRSSPRRAHDYITPQHAERLLQGVRRLGCRAVHIGGGEPLLRPDTLAEVLAAAARCGVAVDYVETNSAWFKDGESATALLADLRKQGLHTLLVSISPFHNEFVPFARVRGVIDACRRSGVGVFPWTAEFLDDLAAFDDRRPHALEEYEARFGGDYLQRALRRYWIHMGGRALELFRPVLGQHSTAEILAAHPGGCARELSDTSHFHVDLYGNYLPGLCVGLALRVADLEAPVSPADYPVLSTLYAAGINGLYEFARTAFDFAPQRDRYLNKCDLCTEIRTFLALGRAGFAELAPVDFYTAR